ncbi:MAG: aspartate 1-decarboxylase [Candidatus Goldiibacteriota bacterium]
MIIEMLKAKIHRAAVTQTELHYEGSITIDEALLEKTGIRVFEKVYIYNIDNGARFETYVIKGRKNAGDICLNGAAARLAEKGDRIIIAAYCALSEDEAEKFKPSIIVLDAKNKIKKTGRK